MPLSIKPPSVNRRYACIVSRDSSALAAVVSSYLYEPGKYFPLFLFPTVQIAKNDDTEPMTQAYMANLLAEQTSVFIANALARLRGPEVLILAGLSEAQESHLLLRDHPQILRITELGEVPAALSSLSLSSKGELKCKSSEVLNGLFIAQKRCKRLAIDDCAPALPEVVNLEKGIVVAEHVSDASAVIAVNYASSINASLLTVDPLGGDKRKIDSWIQGWKENGDHGLFENLRDAVSSRIGGVAFTQFTFATFFTEGLPYSLILNNCVPCSYVHLSLKPDVFIVNNLLMPEGERYGSAVVFSPCFFADEETDRLCELLTNERYYVRPLLGHNATLAQFDFYAQFFPFDILHICSHGGEVDGYEMTERFLDRDGIEHIVEFDEVIGHTPVDDRPGIVEVHRKAFPRALDGFAWMSPELRDKCLPSHVYENMWKAIHDSRGRRRPKSRIAMSCAIACSDSIHQGQFHALASYSSPMVFNNTCWSWHEVALFFIACGARAYIGTLWAIENDAALRGARAFYAHLFSGPMLESVQDALNAIKGTASEDIYIFWGLHFSRIPPANSVERGREEVSKELTHEARAWIDKVHALTDRKAIAKSERIIRAILKELAKSFPDVDVSRLEGELSAEAKIADLHDAMVTVS